jgi:hypothetical protein
MEEGIGLKFEGKRAMDRPRVRWFCQLLDDVMMRGNLKRS